MVQKNPFVYAAVLHCGLKPDGSVRQLLRETLDSLRNMTYPNFRIAVIDNGSIDGSQEMVRNEYRDIELIENGQNLGVVEGYNIGLKRGLHHNADWVLLLNNDIIVDKAMLSEMMKVAGEGIGILGPKTYFYSEPKTFWYAGGTVNFFTGIISHRGIRQEDRGQYDKIEETGYVNGCAMLISRKVIDAVGFLDMIYHPGYSEDADYSLRAKRAGFKVIYVPAAKLWHRVSAFSGGGMSPLKTRYKVEHNFIVLKRYAKWYQWLTIPWCIGVMIILFVVQELLKGNFKVVSSLIQGVVTVLRKLLG